MAPSSLEQDQIWMHFKHVYILLFHIPYVKRTFFDKSEICIQNPGAGLVDGSAGQIRILPDSIWTLGQISLRGSPLVRVKAIVMDLALARHGWLLRILVWVDGGCWVAFFGSAGD